MATFGEVLAEVARRRAELREQRYVPKDFVARLKEIGLYGAVLMGLPPTTPGFR